MDAVDALLDSGAGLSLNFGLLRQMREMGVEGVKEMGGKILKKLRKKLKKTAVRKTHTSFLTPVLDTLAFEMFALLFIQHDHSPRGARQITQSPANLSVTTIFPDGVVRACATGEGLSPSGGPKSAYEHEAV